MAKKKKPASNPARGFATTSVASKPKAAVEKPAASEAKPSKSEAATKSGPTSGPTIEGSPTGPTIQAPVAQTPEELEAQLERDELQLLVEKHAAKVRRESRRLVSKFQTDQRVLRPQAQTISTTDWIAEEILDRIMSLAHAESNDSNRRQGHQPLLKVLSEEEAMARLWSLDHTLRDMGFEEDHIRPALQWLCANAASVDTSSGSWGFQEALEWLALNQTEGRPFSFEEVKPKSLPAEILETSRPATPQSVASSGDTQDVGREKPTAASSQKAPSPPEPVEPGSKDETVSDLDSDIEPDEIIPTYLEIKGRLFELDADAVDTKPRKGGKGAKGRNPLKPIAESPAVRKLRSQLQQLESDALFDQDQADALWPAKRNQIAQAKAAAKASQASEPKPVPLEESKSALPPQEIEPVDGDNDDDIGGIGDMFTAPSDEPIAEASNADEAMSNVVLRDFGKQIGMSPRRILEEAVRARSVTIWADLAISPQYMILR